MPEAENSDYFNRLEKRPLFYPYPAPDRMCTLENNKSSTSILIGEPTTISIKE